MRPISWETFQWERSYISCLMPDGVVRLKWSRVGMPRIDDNALDSAIYMFASTSDAFNGTDPRGSGFVAGYPAHRSDLGDFHHYYAVTNYHVLEKGRAPVVRLNRYDGSTETRGNDIDEWEYNKAADIAALPLNINFRDFNVHFIGTEFFVNQEKLEEIDIGVGDDVFMIGLLVDDKEISERNSPHVRFGHISRMPVLATSGEFQRLNGFRVDMRSRVGFSGSPVFIYRLPFTNMKDLENQEITKCLAGHLGLLGIHWGGFPEQEEKDTSSMTIVVPAWEIKKLLEREVFMNQRKEEESAMAPYPIQEESSAEEESVQSESGDALLKKMLNTPPKPQAKQ